MIYDKHYPLWGFRFEKVSSGAYRVHFASDYDKKVGRYWVTRIEDMTLIDATLHAEQPKRKDVEHLRRMVKKGKLVHVL